MRRLVAIGFIWMGCALAWMVLASTIVFRSGETSSDLLEEVKLLWGPPMVQHPPIAQPEPEPVVAGVPASPSAKPPQPEVIIPVDGSDIDVALVLEQRKKGLLWFATYTVDFEGRYTFVNPANGPRTLIMRFPLAADGIVYDAFKVVDHHGKAIDAVVEDGGAKWTKHFAAGERAEYTVVYKSRGTSNWTYAPAEARAPRIKDFALRLSINTPEVDFPAGTISPTEHHVEGGTWQGEWKFDSLIAHAPIGIDLPKKLNPGPLASKITMFAPVSLLFFFFVVAVLAAARSKTLHPMHYFFIGCAFFAFHLLFAYLVDHLPIAPSFALSAVVSVLLVVSYARLFVGWRFALVEMGISQFLYLVLFSFSFFWTGFTGLAVTIGAILTLFLIMQITGRLDWSRATRILREPQPADPPATVRT